MTTKYDYNLEFCRMLTKASAMGFQMYQVECGRFDNHSGFLNILAHVAWFLQVATIEFPLPSSDETVFFSLRFLGKALDQFGLNEEFYTFTQLPTQLVYPLPTTSIEIPKSRFERLDNYGERGSYMVSTLNAYAEETSLALKTMPHVDLTEKFNTIIQVATRKLSIQLYNTPRISIELVKDQYAFLSTELKNFILKNDPPSNPSN